VYGLISADVDEYVVIASRDVTDDGSCTRILRSFLLGCPALTDRGEVEMKFTSPKSEMRWGARCSGKISSDADASWLGL
jgi:hypothetical protein